MKSTVQEDHLRLRQEAVVLAGRPGDLVQRAAVYHHLYMHSLGNHVFPLLAAHGALWGSGHFEAGLRVGRVLSVQFLANPKKRRAVYAMLEAFAEAFREINRKVCVETYVTYHLTALHGEAAVPFVSPDLLPDLMHCHNARRIGNQLSAADKRALFCAFFLWEQDHVVGPGVDDAVTTLDWPLAKWIAMKPAINFRYFRAAQRLYFSDFSSKAERIEKGLAAFDIADVVGWKVVESALKKYRIMPDEFFEDPLEYFAALKNRLTCR